MPVLLHGSLQVSVNEAKNLPDKDKALFFSKKDKSDPFVTLEVGKTKLLRTAVILDNLNPKWMEKFRVDVASDDDEIVFHIKDKDVAGSQSLGFVKIRSVNLLAGPIGPAWFDVTDSKGKKTKASLHLAIQYVSMEQLSKSPELPDTYFDISSDNRVTLYQDAHTPATPLLTSITLSDGRKYKPTNAWIDIYEALKGARHLIYITGWSVYTRITLVRGAEGGDKGETLGELLKAKAKDGVRVLILVWDERMSTDVTAGLLGTHDNETAIYFQGSGVEVVLVSRQKRGAAGVLDSNWTSTCFSHHQKSVIVDADVPAGQGFGAGDKRRRFITFIGGLDLTDGRYDTQQHALFSTLTTDHKDDFYQKCFTVDKTVGPREPWHDVHAKLEGPAAYDVLKNFEERWRMQAKHKGNLLVEISDAKFLTSCAAPLPSVSDKWRVQLLRSINADSASFVGDKMRSLASQKGKKTEDSIHRAYIHHIRRAKQFIYIENQYFLGSSHEWLGGEATSKARHLIPLELANAICEKIATDKRFAVYIVVPMFPEGDPHSAAVQEILYWQYRTIEMMYDRVAKAIRAKGIKALPTDYLNFYCLGNREPGDLPPELAQPQSDSPGAKLRASRRHMIYVHSKLMIVDDEIVIIGSANINQRSMGGNRDTEIAICAHQPYHTLDYNDGRLPRRDVYAFRTALWAEHTGRILPEYADPSSEACVKAVNSLGQKNWTKYSGNEVVELEGHLMLYPLLPHPDGTLSAIPGCPNFPDTTASIVGKKSAMFPMSLTT